MTHKNKIIKMDFTSGSSNILNIELNYGIIIECLGKAAGIINNDYFSAKYTFSIDTINLKIYDIFFTDVKKIGETNFTENTNENCVDNIHNNNNDKMEISSSYSDIVTDTFEQSVYNTICSILNNAIITKNETNLIVELTNKIASIIDFLVLHLELTKPTLEYHSIDNYKNKNDTEDTNNKINYQTKQKNNLFNQDNRDSKSSTSKQSTKSTTDFNNNKFEQSSYPSKSKKKYTTKSKKNILKLLSWSINIAFLTDNLKKATNNNKKYNFNTNTKSKIISKTNAKNKY
jgi:hypothetical protein